MRYLIRVLVIGISIFVLLGTEVHAVEKRDWKIIATDLHDVKNKTQIRERILYTVLPNAADIEKLIEARLTELQSRTGFKYHQNPTHLQILIYSDRAGGVGGQYIGRLNMINGDKDLEVDHQVIAAALANSKSSNNQKQYGLSESERKRLFYESVDIEDVAYKQVRSGGDVNTIMEAGWRKLAKKYKISYEQFEEIQSDGIVRKWPTP